MKNKYIFLIIAIFWVTQLYSQHDLYGLWSRKTGVTAPKSGVAVSQMITDSQGNMYVCGRYYGTVSLSDNTCVLSNSGGYPYLDSHYHGYFDASNRWNDGNSEKSDGFVTKYDSKGKWLWTVSISTNVMDAITSMALSDDEQNLIFLGQYGNSLYSGITVNAHTITYGDGVTEPLTFNTPQITLYNFCMVKLNTNDGSKGFHKYLGYGFAGAAVGAMLRIYYLTQNNDGYIYISGVRHNGTTYTLFVDRYDFNGNLINPIPTSLVGNVHGWTSPFSKNKSLSSVYSLLSHQAGGLQWDTYLVKTDLTSNTNTFLSFITSYTHSNTTIYTQNYGRYGITGGKLDINDANTHLFLTGNTVMDFVYKATNQTITNPNPANVYEGDGIIICYDPSTVNINWMVNIRALGDQRIWDCKFDETTQTLWVVGSIDENEVDFNPHGTPMKYKAAAGQAMFYAVYNMNGTCLKVEVMDAAGDEVAQSLDFYGNDISMFGTFTGSPFQPDPADRIEPMRTTEASTFLARYSIDPLSSPEPPTPGSYSAADNIIGSYGRAYHNIVLCMSLGDDNDSVKIMDAQTYLPERYTSGTANPNYDGLQGNLLIDTPTGGITAKVKAKNAKITPAYLMAWIDFNENGVFDPSEASVIETIPAQTNTPVNFDIKWNSLPNVTKSKLNTFIRIRLTSEKMDSTWVAGNAADGEVEDYYVTLDFLDLEKEAKSNNINPAKADIGDTITYKLTLTNKITGNITLFDPIPEGTKYVSSTPSGTN